MSVTFESPTHRTSAKEAYFTPLNMPSLDGSTTTTNNDGANTPYFTAPINPGIHQDFLNAIHHRHASQPVFTSPPAAAAAPPNSPLTLSLNNTGSLAHRRSMGQQSQHQQHQHQPHLQTKLAEPVSCQRMRQLIDQPDRVLVLDVRSFVQFSHARIRTAINVSVPNTILKRPTFTMDKLYEAIVLDSDRDRLKQWSRMECIVVYDQSSPVFPPTSSGAYLINKLSEAGYKGRLGFLQGKRRKK